MPALQINQALHRKHCLFLQTLSYTKQICFMMQKSITRIRQLDCHIILQGKKTAIQAASKKSL